MDTSTAIGKLASVCKALGGQRQLAKVIGVTDGFISMVLRGRRVPGRRLASLLQAKFGIPVSEWDTESKQTGQQ